MVTNYPAVRAMCKALERNESLQTIDEAWMCDRHFDGGEYSDAHWCDIHLRETHRIIAAVAARYGMTAEELDYAYHDWLHEMYAHEWEKKEREAYV